MAKSEAARASKPKTSAKASTGKASTGKMSVGKASTGKASSSGDKTISSHAEGAEEVVAAKIASAEAGDGNEGREPA